MILERLIATMVEQDPAAVPLDVLTKTEKNDTNFQVQVVLEAHFGVMRIQSLLQMLRV